MGEKKSYRRLVVTGDKPIRADRFLLDTLPGFSRQSVHRLISSGAIGGGDHNLKKGSLLSPGTTLVWPDAPDLSILPQPNANVVCNIVYNDDEFVIVCKPSGVNSLPLDPLDTEALANGVVAKLPECAGVGGSPLEAGMVNRLDQSTSGLVIVAKNQVMFESLLNCSRNSEMAKTYHAVVDGVVKGSRTLTYAIGHHPSDTTRMIANTDENTLKPRGNFRQASTKMKPLTNNNRVSLVEIEIDKGTRHQIRLHLATAGHPIIGDCTYGKAAEQNRRLMLHASAVRFKHPRTSDELQINCELPPEFSTMLGSV